jgi:hypothetical protein
MGYLTLLKNKYNGWIYFVGIPFNDEITIKENYLLKRNYSLFWIRVLVINIDKVGELIIISNRSTSTWE